MMNLLFPYRHEISSAEQPENLYRMRVCVNYLLQSCNLYQDCSSFLFLLFIILQISFYSVLPLLY